MIAVCSAVLGCAAHAVQMAFSTRSGVHSLFAVHRARCAAAASSTVRDLLLGEHVQLLLRPEPAERRGRMVTLGIRLELHVAAAVELPLLVGRKVAQLV